MTTSQKGFRTHEIQAGCCIALSTALSTEKLYSNYSTNLDLLGNMISVKLVGTAVSKPCSAHTQSCVCGSIIGLPSHGWSGEDE